MDDKKRKRQINGVNTPNKKVAFTDSNAASRVKIALLDENTTHPALVFASGIKVPATSFTAYSKPYSKKVREDPHPATHELLLQSSNHSRLDFTARSIAEQDELAHYVAVYDSKTNQAQLIPVHQLSLYSTLRAETREVAQDEMRRTYAQQKEELGKAFGTKKAQKAIADKTINAINKNTSGKSKQDDVQTAILEAIDDAMADTATAAQTAQDEFAAKPIPKPNLDAETVEKVYPFSTLVPASEARLLNVKEWQEKGSSDEVQQFNSRYVAARFKSVAASENASRLKALQYLALLLDFHDALQPGGRNSGKKVPKKDVLAKKLPDWPEQLVDLARRKFSNPDNELPKWHQDLLCTHMCALTLYIDGWTTDTTALKNDLKLDNRQISQYFNELGCKVKAPTEKERSTFQLNKAVAAVTRIAKLKLPLDFPKPRTGRRK